MPVEQINGTPLAYESIGEGDAIVMVHGSWNQREGWMFLVPELSPTFRVTTYDRRGHGASTSEPTAGTFDDDVDDLAALIERLQIAPANVVGSSYGAIISLKLAAVRRELVRKVVAHEPPAIGVLRANPSTKAIADEQFGLLAEVRRRLESGDHVDAARFFVDEVAIGPGSWDQLPAPVQQLFLGNAMTFLGETREPEALGFDLDVLSRVQVPVLLTQGDQSPPMFAAVLDCLAPAAPGIERALIPGAGHVPHATHPREYAVLIRDFFSSAEAP
jgi:pimeloyl-ACP methyl ester carboxylesterase